MYCLSCYFGNTVANRNISYVESEHEELETQQVQIQPTDSTITLLHNLQQHCTFLPNKEFRTDGRDSTRSSMVMKD